MRAYLIREFGGPVKWGRLVSDVFNTAKRRAIMRAVKTARTEPEQRLALGLRALGFRFGRNSPSVFGRPDFTFPRLRVAVFVDGDFWHGRAWFEKAAAPSTNARFWIEKFERNRRRDRLVDRTLRRAGWSVLRMWASDVRSSPTECVSRVHTCLRRRARSVARKTGTR